MLISVTTNFIHIFVVTLLSRLQYIHYQAVKSKVWQRNDVTTENQTLGGGERGCCATPLVSESCAVVYSRVHPSGITRGYAWCVLAGDGGCIQESSFLNLSPTSSPFKRPRQGRWVSAKQYNKGAGWRNKAVSWHPYCICKRNKEIHATAYRTKTLDMKKLHQNSFGGAKYKFVSLLLKKRVLYTSFSIEYQRDKQNLVLWKTRWKT